MRLRRAERGMIFLLFSARTGLGKAVPHAQKREAKNLASAGKKCKSSQPCMRQGMRWLDNGFSTSQGHSCGVKGVPN